MIIFRLLAIFVFTATVGLGQNPPAATPGPDTARLLIQRMSGEWDVAQRMWLGFGAEATDLPAAVAHRHLLEGTILEEQMELAPGAKGNAFTRMAYFDYNGVSHQYEYFSLDTRAPQMMNERSYDGGTQDKTSNQAPIILWGGMFVAPKWGNTTNAAFRYRLVMGPVLENRQVVRLYLTPVSGDTGGEFLAFEYVYTRRP